MDAIDFENHDEVMKIFDWCKNTKPLVLARLAELVPIFEENGTWHPIAFRLINAFWDIQDVLNNLDANGNFFLGRFYSAFIRISERNIRPDSESSSWKCFTVGESSFGIY